jgi:pantoate--beta-alanine ligase
MPSKMHLVADIPAARRICREWQGQGVCVGLVPTMGALHEGHLSLIRAAKGRCQRVAVSIFVNPIQFGPGEDFHRYPRPMERDREVCAAAGADLLFAPRDETMYPGRRLTFVRVEELPGGLCGPFRPGHFDGVATVVAKLFHILPADVAFFGEKDYQQLIVIRQMVKDLDFPIEIVGCPIVREADGLAMSSRNVHLTPEERGRATGLSRALFAAAERAARGERRSEELIRAVRADLVNAGIESLDYVEIVDAETLAPLARLTRPARLCAAARLGQTRLIDNVPLDLPVECG